MAKLIITADDSYVEKLKKHLEVEHPSTKGKMSIRKSIKKGSFTSNLKEQLKKMGEITEKVLKDATDPIKDIGI